METKIKREKKLRRQKRIRAKIYGTAARPRLCVFRSGKHIYAQLVDDKEGITLVSAKDQELKSRVGRKKSLTTKAEHQEETAKKTNVVAYEVGKLLAEKALKNKIEKVVFDRRGYAYHGKVRALAEGARERGLKF